MPIRTDEDMGKPLGPTFAAELKAAGVSGDGISWGSDGRVQFRSDIAPSVRAAFAAVVAAHNPNAPPPQSAHDKLIAACDSVLAAPASSAGLKTLAQALKEYVT